MSRPIGGYIFAERPDLAAPDARIIWRADLDPETIEVDARPGSLSDPDSIEPSQLAPWLSFVATSTGEHAVLSDGWHHIRLDITSGTLSDGMVLLRYRLKGVYSAERRLLPLRRFLDLCRNRRFPLKLYSPDRRMERQLMVLRVHDAVRAGASQRDIVRVLYNEECSRHSKCRRSDSLRSRVRRLIKHARAQAAGGYRTLIRK